MNGSEQEEIRCVQEEESTQSNASMESASKCDYVREGVQAIQAQIDVIVAAQKTYGSDMNNGKSGVA